MPAFISKIQYKSCEEGEYYLEQERTLQETLTLLHDFPWDRERYAEIDLTGPSITIANRDNEFLKAGIHYGGTFHMYFLDKRNRLHERYPIHMDDIEDMIADFYNGQLKLSQFGGSTFGYFNRRCFLTKSFNYTTKVSSLLGLLFHWLLIFFLSFLLGSYCLLNDFTNPVGLIFMIPALIPGALGGWLFFKFYRSRHRHLHISRGDDVFVFGENENDNREFNKADIIKIIQYKPTNTRANNFEYYDVVFKDQLVIRFSNVLISDLEAKFSPRWKLTPEIVYTNTWVIPDILIHEIDE